MSDPTLSAAAEKVQMALAGSGVKTTVAELPTSTRTARDAAASVGCDVSDIVKSLIFVGQASGQTWLVLIGGAHRVDEHKLAGVVGEAMRVATAEEARERTGFAVGGIPPVGHITKLPTVVDHDLEMRTLVWAAAGTPHAVFQIDARELVRITAGIVAHVRH
jgi:prolyl-tRNA editing enzyme YbaK/EbsC (Cys-tRNA(Pro) deacylase)